VRRPRFAPWAPRNNRSGGNVVTGTGKGRLIQKANIAGEIQRSAVATPFPLHPGNARLRLQQRDRSSAWVHAARALRRGRGSRLWAAASPARRSTAPAPPRRGRARETGGHASGSRVGRSRWPRPAARAEGTRSGGVPLQPTTTVQGGSEFEVLIRLYQAKTGG